MNPEIKERVRERAERMLSLFMNSRESNSMVLTQIEQTLLEVRDEAIREAAELAKAMEYDCYGLCAKKILSFLSANAGKEK